MLGVLGKAEDLLSGQKTLNEGPTVLGRGCEFIYASVGYWG